ncbi:hypothetical protein C9900_22550 [Salmonella enterica subsp. enterica serovar Kentucky]|nr:hypothetical protein C9900_22550 [Salmonella enterica subsp. enterica serovar Kentucky]
MNQYREGKAKRTPARGVKKNLKPCTYKAVGAQVYDQVRFFALHRIKPHAPPLVRAPVNSFEF